MKGNFFAMMSRMKYIERWALMKNTAQENVCEHSLEVAMIAHALAVIGNTRFNKDLNAEKAALIGMYHDSSEIITGDMPTPVKYYNEEIKNAMKEVECVANKKILNMLPEDMRESYKSIFFKTEEDEYLWKLVKGADKISALIKCMEEMNTGNTEFRSAKASLEKSIDQMELPEIEVFIKDFLPAYGNTLDELSNPNE
ncbi:MAG: 5'-deoxynucleotidase [Lachnospiraceae bacterium]|nr:5'-deoxynucleotidase [Lachnospiraceae bacterium]